jgi:nucleoid DNA-binding protein
VILPGFGGLVTNYAPANIHPATHEFAPPSTALAFNPRLSHNDGLLIKHVSRVENLSYNTTAREVDKWIEELQARINNGENVELPGIGTFKRDVEHNLRFQADPEANFLLEGFGLRKFTAFPIIRDNKGAEVKKQPEAQLTTPPPPYQKKQGETASNPVSETVHAASDTGTDQHKPTPRRKKRQQPKRDYAIAATVLTIIAVGQLLIFNVTPDQLTLGHLPLFERFNPVSGEELIQDKASNKSAIDEKLEYDALHSLPYQELSADDFSLPSQKGQKGTKAEQKPTSGKGYYVILGSFKNAANAEQLKESISDKPRARIFQAPNGHHRVGYFLHWEEDQAVAQLNRLRNRKGDDLWLMAYRD